jgi:hypothetical protein
VFLGIGIAYAVDFAQAILRGRIMPDDRQANRCPWCGGRGMNAAVYGPAPCPDCQLTEWEEDDTNEEEGGEDDG